MYRLAYFRLAKNIVLNHMYTNVTSFSRVITDLEPWSNSIIDCTRLSLIRQLSWYEHNIAFFLMWRHWRQLIKSSILYHWCFSRNGLLIVSHISGFTFDARLLWEIPTCKTNQRWYTFIVGCSRQQVTIKFSPWCTFIFKVWLTESCLVNKSLVYWFKKFIKNSYY